MNNLEKKQNLPPHKNGNINHVPNQIALQGYAFSGPIPPPPFLADYDKFVPEISKRFLEGPFIEAEHRRALELETLRLHFKKIELENKVVDSQIRLSSLGQIFGFIITIISIFLSFSFVYMGYEITGILTFIAALIPIVGVSIYKDFTKRSNDIEGK